MLGLKIGEGGTPPSAEAWEALVGFILASNFSSWKNWVARLVGNEGINLYIGILGMKIPSFPTKGQLENGFGVFPSLNGVFPSRKGVLSSRNGVFVFPEWCSLEKCWDYPKVVGIFPPKKP